jgi:hypothetical protein
VFFPGILLVAKGLCRKSGYHQSEDLAKFGYKARNKIKIYNHPYIFWLHNEN